MEYRNDQSVTDGHDGEEIIEVRDLVVRFGDVTAVDGISFSVRRGEIFGFLGPNGAGKTTTIRTITTIQRMTSGSIMVDGFDVSDDYLEVRRRIGIAQQHISLDSWAWTSTWTAWWTSCQAAGKGRPPSYAR